MIDRVLALTALLRREPGLWFVPMAVGGGLVLQLHAVEHGPVLCVSRLLFGVPCGGCGLTRAYVALGHGLWQTAVDYNPLAPLLFVWMVAWWCTAVWRLVRQRPVATTPRWIGLTALVAFGCLWMARTVTFFSSPDWWATMQRDAVVLRLWHAITG